MVSHLSLAALGLGHLNMCTMGTQTKRSDSFLEVTTLLQVRKTDHTVNALRQFHTDYMNCVFFFFLIDFYTNDAPLQFGSLKPGVVKTQDSHIERDLHLSLDDLYHGCTKKIKISRRVRATSC